MRSSLPTSDPLLAALMLADDAELTDDDLERHQFVDLARHHLDRARAAVLDDEVISLAFTTPFAAALMRDSVDQRRMAIERTARRLEALLGAVN